MLSPRTIKAPTAHNELLLMLPYVRPVRLMPKHLLLNRSRQEEVSPIRIVWQLKGKLKHNDTAHKQSREQYRGDRPRFSVQRPPVHIFHPTVHIFHPTFANPFGLVWFGLAIRLLLLDMHDDQPSSSSDEKVIFLLC